MENQTAIFAAGCFWGVEESFRTLKGVSETKVGYIGGKTEGPTYEDVCSHGTGHAEAVHIAFNPSEITYNELLEIFWNIHDPTQVDRQGPDVGDQYRSAIFYNSAEQKEQAESSRDNQADIKGEIATEIVEATEFFDAEDYHQQYVAKRKGLV